MREGKEMDNKIKRLKRLRFLEGKRFGRGWARDQVFKMAVFGATILLGIGVFWVFKDRVHDEMRKVLGTQVLVDPRGELTPKEELIFFLNREGISVVSEPQVLIDGLKVKLQTGTEVFFPPNEIEMKVAALQIILNRFRIEDREVQKIDLRYSKPVVNFKDGSR